MNLSELQQKANQVLFNSDEAIRKWVEFISAPAGTVSLEYYDKNGNLQQVSFDNRNKLVQNFISNVNSAMSKTFYVDAVNGNDGNDGSQNAPFKTLQKAVDSVPFGGFVKVILVSDYTGTFNSSGRTIAITVDSGKVWTIPMGARCNITGCNLTITNRGQIVIDRGDGSNINGINYSGFWVEAYESNSFLSHPTNLFIVNLGGQNPIRIDQNRCLLGAYTYSTINAIQVNLGIFNIYTSGDFIIDGTLFDLRGGNGSFFWKTFGVNTSINVVNSNGDAVDIKTKISGIVKDSNGVPRNIVSNIIF